MPARVASYPLSVLFLAIGYSCSLPACLDLGDSSDAGAGGTGSGTVLSGICAASFSPCGGDVTGTWQVQSICSVGNPADTVNANFTASYPDCAGVCTSNSMTVSGNKTYSGTSVTSTESFDFSENLSLSDACFNEALGTSLSDSTCQAAAGHFDSASSASCGLLAGACNCQVTDSLNNSTTSYVASGTSLTEPESNTDLGTTVDYCVIGNTMTQRRTLPPGIQYVVTYTRQ